MSNAAKGKRGTIDQLLRSVKSQVFEDDQNQENGSTTDLSADSAPRKLLNSWTFSKTQQLQTGSTSNASLKSLKSEPVSPKLEPKAGPVCKDTENEELEPPKETKDRAQSWSFWSRNTRPVDQPTAVETEATLSEPVRQDPVVSPKKKKQKLSSAPSRPDLVVPQLESLPCVTPGTYVYSAVNNLLLLAGREPAPVGHLSRKIRASSFRRVLIIGVHGFFPTKMIRPLIGEPTGTSARFAKAAEDAISAWAQEQGMSIETQKIALEKEGKIFDRVEFFFEAMQKWHEEVEKADFIYVCAHSQGTPVAMMLISKMIEHGLIADNKRIAILGMAGINIGPYYGMDQSLFIRAYSSIENESMLELFQFQNFQSLQSRKYLESVRNLIAHNVKITLVGSVNDQLVPLYSAIGCHISHPNIYKAVYIDGKSNTPDFVARIVKLSCMLQNLGYTDHGVIAEMSHALAGPLTGGGHSRIYNSPDVYKLALNFALKTMDSSLVVRQPVRFHEIDVSDVGSNPFTLPWCTRGLFFDVKKRLDDGEKEIEMVFKEFDNWNPESKVLRDVKYRLNGIKDKL
ncbi:hypothetical protein KL912_000550 [Ogataea haglerorum]|nr:hypothetical protein KL912_000550 [Ogataea haglerorum]